MVNTPHKHTHKGFTCSKQFRLLGHRLQFKLLPFLLFWILRRRHFCFYTPWCLLTNVTVKSSLCWCHLSAGTCRLTGQIRQLLLALLTDEATQNQHPKWRRKQMDMPNMAFFKERQLVVDDAHGCVGVAWRFQTSLLLFYCQERQ